jgi:hypothetical protein
VQEKDGKVNQGDWSDPPVIFNIQTPQPPTNTQPSQQGIQTEFGIRVIDGTRDILEELNQMLRGIDPDWVIDWGRAPQPYTPNQEYISQLYYTLKALSDRDFRNMIDALRGLSIYTFNTPLYGVNNTTGERGSIIGMVLYPSQASTADHFKLYMFYSEEFRQRILQQGRNPPYFQAILFHELSHVLYWTFLTPNQRNDFDSYHRRYRNPEDFVTT